jgi:hypothetical protein
MSDNVLSTRPINSSEKVLRDKFAEQLAGQSEQMDSLARQLITLELAVPGIYAAVLKLVQGDKATVQINNLLIGAFVCWSLALGLTLFSLIPRDWKVDPTLLKPDVAGSDQPSGSLSIEEFFSKSARYKRRLLIPAAILFWLGIVGAALVVV